MKSLALKRSDMFQHLNTKGPIFHVTMELGAMQGKRAGNLSEIVLNLARQQRADGFDARIAIPKTMGSALYIKTEEIEGVPVISLGNKMEKRMITDSQHEQLFLEFSKDFWDYIDKNFDNKVALIHAHGYTMGSLLENRPAQVNIKTIFSPFSLDVYDHSSTLKGFKYSDCTLFWSDTQRLKYMVGTLGAELSLLKDNIQTFKYHSKSWNPADFANPPKEIYHEMLMHYYTLVYGDTGLKFALDLLNSTPIPLGDLEFICQDELSKIRGRRDMSRKLFLEDERIIKMFGSQENIFTYGKGLDNEVYSPEYRGALGSAILLFELAAKKLSAEMPIVIGINDAGKGDRETPILTIAQGSKGNVVIGLKTFNQISTIQMDMLVKQLPPGEFAVVGACDNVWAGGLSVGDHPLSLDNHRIFNLTRPWKVVGEEIEENDQSLAHLCNLGILIIDPVTGARKAFAEKLPTVQSIQDLAELSNTGGFVDANSMVKIVHKDIAAMLADKQHYKRPSYKSDGKSNILETYAIIIPDWSALFDDPSIHSTTISKWTHQREKKGMRYDERDWRLLWAIANDIVLSALEPIAMSEMYFGKTKSTSVNWESINGACIGVLKKNGGIESNELKEDEWYFERSDKEGLEKYWKEIFLAAMSIRYGDNAGKKTYLKNEWNAVKPININPIVWKTLWDIAVNLDKNENGIAAARIDGTWIDTGVKIDLFKTWMEIVSPDPDKRAVIRNLTGINCDGHIDKNTVQGYEHLVVEDPSSVFVGGNTKIVSSKNSKIHIGKNVVIVGLPESPTLIEWNEKSDLYIPDNTVIFASTLVDIDPNIRENGPKMIYKFNNHSGQTFKIDPNGTNKTDIKFGFYGGVMFGTFALNDGRELHTIYPMEMDVKQVLDDSEKGQKFLGLFESITNPELRNHLIKHFDGQSPIQAKVPFTDMSAKDILWDIGF